MVFVALFASNVAGEFPIALPVVGLLFTVKGAADAVIRIPAGRIADRAGRGAPLVVFYAYTALVLALLSVARDPTPIFLLLALGGLAFGGRVVMDFTIPGDVIGREASGTGFSYFSTLFEVGHGLGALLAGILAMVLPTSDIFKLSSIIALGGTIPLTAIKTGSGREIRKGENP